MRTMPSYKDLLLLPKPNAPLHRLREEDVLSALQTSSPGKFTSSAKGINATHQRDPARSSKTFACDDFRMYDYKVRRCMRGRSHDWTDCPFAHPGEKARRRDPRKIHYSAVPCPDFRKGSCRRGDACEYAHGVFECWLHPARYRTQPCKDGKNCTRRVCFFAHSMQELRHVAVSVEESVVERASYEHEAALAPQTNSSGLSSPDVHINVCSISETLSMLTLSSQNLSGLPFEATPLSATGFSSNSGMGVPMESHSPSSKLPTMVQGPSDGSCGMGTISQDDSSASVPTIVSSTSSLQLCIPVVGRLCSSNSHTTSECPLYVGGSPNFNVSAIEVPDMVHYRGFEDVAMLQAYLNVSGRGRTDANEVAKDRNGLSESLGFTDLFRREMCEFSSYNSSDSYGLSSPTSTLAGPLWASPFSSPPLSPLSTPSSETSNLFSSRGHSDVQVDDIRPKADLQTQNRHCVEKFELKHTSRDQQSLSSHHDGRLWGHSAPSQCLLSPLSPQCTSGQNNRTLCFIDWNSKDAYKCDCDVSDDLQPESSDTIGGESAMPDLGWVHELVM